MTEANRISKLVCGRATKWIVLAVWLFLVFALFLPSSKLTGAQENEASSWLPNNAESTEVLERSERFVPSDSVSTVVVYDRGGAAFTAADHAKVQRDVQRFYDEVRDRKAEKKSNRTNSIVTKVQGPIPAKDGKALQAIIDLKLGEEGWNKLGPAVEDMRDIAQPGGAGLQAHVTGPGGYGGDFSNVFAGFDATLLLITAVIVIVILLLTYRSPILWALPLLCALFALTVSQALIYLLVKSDLLTVNGQSAFILTVLVLGAGTDYALLLIARYREELRRHQDRHTAMAVALHRAGPAILASGATVALSLLCLMVAVLNSTKSLGPVTAIGIVVVMLAQVTLLPALLVIFGRWVFWPKRPVHGSSEPTERGFWSRVGARIKVRPRATWIVTALVLGALAYAITGLDVGGVQQRDSFSSGKPDSVTGEAVLEKHFPIGTGAPLQVVAKADSAQPVIAALSSVPKVTDVAQRGSRDGIAYIEGTLTAPPDGEEGFNVVERARDAVHRVPGAGAQVGGGTAVTLDINDASRRDQKWVIPIVLVVVFGILALLLRALVAPLLLVATVVLSYGAALGVSALAFNYLFDFAGADPSFPLWAFVFLVALGTDYNIFLMTRVHEEAKQRGTRRGALIGLAATGAVITSAGLVLAGTFTALGTLPLVFVTELGFVVAFGVLLDTFVVRSVLVTALNLDVGRWMWWPSPLSHKRDDEPTDDVPETTTGDVGAVQH